MHTPLCIWTFRPLERAAPRVGSRAACDRSGCSQDSGGPTTRGRRRIGYAAMADKAAMLDALADCGVALGGAGAAGTSHASLGAIAASRGHINALKALATRLDLSSHAGRDGWTAAGAAALEGSVASLEALFALGVDLSRACNRHGEPPLVRPGRG
ncbi:hypothetical protein M885DRAFT_513999 [Pelagophyceae sp. CCMP2097]|nr:hypothetical protein M885DRAFT_513999 [Pelagophyceae sp. CCMP2097]